MPVVVEKAVAVKWLEWLFAWAEGEIEFRALGKSGPRLLATRDPDELGGWLVRNQDRDIYHGAATRAPGSAPPGRLETVYRVPALWADLDRVEDKAAVLELARGCYCPPSGVNDSGGGLHLWWRLVEAEAAAPELVELLKGLARVFGGDPAVCDLARIMRLPGTLNHKYNPPRPCRVLWQSDATYQLPDIAEWLSWQRELRGEPVDPWLAAAARVGVRVPLDVEEALAEMAPGNIHDRQLRVSASLAAHGVSEEEIVTRLMTATRLAIGEEGRRWDWRKEEAGIRRMIGGAKEKFQVINLQQEREERAPKSSAADDILHGKIARVALERWGRPIRIIDGDPWAYKAGFWEPIEDTNKVGKNLRAHIQMAGRALGKAGGQQLNGAWRWIMEDLTYWHDDVKWDQGRVVVGRNGALNLATGQLVPHSPEHYATRSVACDIDPAAGCPIWLQFLRDALPEDTEAVIGTVQEWFGAMLVRGKTREMKKGLIIHGPSYTGKTQVAKVARAVIGGKVCGLLVRDMGGPFGVQPLIKASAWISDDAVAPNEELDVTVYKHAVTGEQMNTDIKHKEKVEVAFELPVLLTMNDFPRVKDSSDAVYNRTLVLAMRIVRAIEDASKGKEIGDVIVAEELAGILNWAAEGWRRLNERGWFDPPKAMIAAATEFKMENNPWKDFSELCLEENPDRMIARNDLIGTFNGWVKQEMGGREWSGKAIAKHLKAAMPKVINDKVHEGRVWIGLAFKEPARAFLPLAMGEKPRELQQLNMGLTAAIRERHRPRPKTVF
jgi:P4 family phage/plasmid primase-like protien